MLYIVATPIGNLSEITYRAVETLQQVDFIAAEDVRHSLPLLKRYAIAKPMIAYQKFNEKKSCQEILAHLKNGKDVALISDAGMPLISDPGSILIQALVQEKLEFTVISGPCSVINALVLSGQDTAAFCMAGFLPEKNIDRMRHLQKFEHTECTLVFLSAPHDVDRDLEFLLTVLGPRKVALVREISKIYEQVIRFTLGERIDFVRKGEFVIVVEGYRREQRFAQMDIYAHYCFYLEAGLPSGDAMKRVAAERKISKSAVYNEILTKKR